MAKNNNHISVSTLTGSGSVVETLSGSISANDGLRGNLSGSGSVVETLSGSIGANDSLHGSLTGSGSAVETLSGNISANDVLHGSLSGNIGMSGGVSSAIVEKNMNYEKLINLPQIEGVTLVGNKSYEELNLNSLSNSELENLLSF